ncbi:MAG: hypothetical protein DRQ88_02990 [Epsilonproteobacteria bacterium]|nr:MAG: hypothetical protein DRQ89_01945 [Campylobacterota bacterium]RLA67438.1 MAG: hypothetical protein DRQ88_02990 [Campylobacterota bacterium]
MEPKIIVVDSYNFSRKTTVRLLEDLSFTVVGEANSIQKTQKLINTSHCNMCLVDMTGIEFTRTLKERNKHLGIILTSFLTLEGLKIDAILAGVSDNLEKPLNKSDLEKSIYYLQQIITMKD